MGSKDRFEPLVLPQKQLKYMEIKKGNLNYDQSGRAYPDEPNVKENWECIWEFKGKHYILVGDNEHKEWEVYLGEMINFWVEHHGYLDIDTDEQEIINFYNKTKKHEGILH